MAEPLPGYRVKLHRALDAFPGGICPAVETPSREIQSSISHRRGHAEDVRRTHRAAQSPQNRLICT